MSARPATILIVDDEPQNTRLLEALLRPEGYSTLTAASGREALAAIAKSAPDLVLLDVMMPGMDGYEVATALKSDPATSSIPVIMLTALVDRSARLSGLDAGAEEFLTKPVDRAELWLRVRNLLRLKTLGDFFQNHSLILERQVKARTESLHESESRFRQVAENIRDVFFLKDVVSGRLLYISPAYEEIWLHSCVSAYANPELWTEAIHPEDRAAIFRKYGQIMPAEKFDYEYRIVRADGSVRWLETRGFPVHDDAGRTMRIAGIVKDITEHKQATLELRESERRFSEMLGNLELVALMYDCDGRLTYCNDCLLRLTGWRSDEVLGKNWFDLFIPPESIDAAKAVVARLLADEPGAAHFENEIQTRTGERRLIRWNNSVLRSGTGERVGAASIGEDITESREAEQRIVYLNRVYAVLSGINTLIVRVRDRDELFREACRIAVEAGGFRMAWIAIVDRSAMKVVPLAFAGGNDELVAIITKRFADSHDAILGNAVTALAISGRQAVVSNDLQSDPRVLFGKQYAQSGIRSMVNLPLLVADEVVGVLALYAGEIEFFHAEEMKLLSELAGDIAFAVSHIGSQQKIARLSRVQTVTSEINALIVRVRDRQELCTETCRIAVEHGGFGIAWIGWFDPVTQDITPAAWAGIDSAGASSRRSSRADIPEGQGLAGRAVREKKAVFDNHLGTRDDIGGSGRKEAIRRGYRSLIALPLMAEGAVLGTVSLFAEEADFFDAEEVSLLTDVAGNIAFAVENIDRQLNLTKLSRIRALSGEINAAIVRIQDRDALLQEACQIAVDYGKFELVWVASIDEEKQEIRARAWEGFSPAAAHAVNWVDANKASSTLAEILQSRRPSVRNDIETMGPGGPLRQEALRRGFLSTVCLPLQVDDRVVGAMILFAGGRNFFDTGELALLNEVASNLSFALQSIARREQLDYLAYYDVLTGLANRGLFLERVAQHLRGAVKAGHKLAVFLIDLERFKNINDSLGRPAGDSLLKQVAEWIIGAVEDANLVARVGADQFAVVLPEVKQEGDVARLVEKKMRAFLEHPFRLGEVVFTVAMRVGITLFPEDGLDADALLKNAEAALKKTKASGDRFLFYTPKMTSAAAGRLTLESQLRQALEKEEFVLHYQPKVNLASGKLTGAEALIRWNDPRTGLVPPAQFIPILEETGLIYEAGRWAVRKALEDYLRWRNAGLPAVRIAVNVSPLQLRNRGFVAEIERNISVDAHAAAGLELEITESLIMEDVKHSVASLQAIRAMGITVAIDDFGTGFSSLSYLAKLPIDTLKIDRSFVIEMTVAPEGLSLVSTIISLAHSLNLKVVAEGVETDEQSRLLLLLNCDELQGFLFSRPVNAETFEAKFLAAARAPGASVHVT